MKKVIDARDRSTQLTTEWFPCHCDGCLYLMAVAAQSKGRDELALCDLLVNQAMHNVGTEFVYIDHGGTEHSFAVYPVLQAWDTEDTAGYYAPNSRDMGGN
mgnify:CR=1 FL=1